MHHPPPFKSFTAQLSKLSPPAGCQGSVAAQDIKGFSEKGGEPGLAGLNSDCHRWVFELVLIPLWWLDTRLFCFTERAHLQMRPPFERGA